MAEAFVIPPPPTPSLAVEGERARFPVGRIFCIGRNYADHAREMGHDPDREPPFFFMKPVSALATEGVFRLPKGAQEVHHEVELVVALKSGGAEIAPEEALAHVFGYGVGLDMTRRDLQAVAKKLGRPWETAKGFDGSAPCGALAPAARIGHPAKGGISLSVNGEIRQKGDLGEMIWGVADLLAAISRSMALRPGDLILTGTPAGVGAVRPGDRLEARIEGVGALDVEVTG